ncbi:GPI anchored serine-threonine rich family protein [Streptomyces sp. NPDC055663]
MKIWKRAAVGMAAWSLVAAPSLLASTQVQATNPAAAHTDSRTSRLDVFVPPVTSPTAKSVWTAGQTVEVTWDTADPPQHITNPKGAIYLRKGDRTGPMLDEGFDILKGRQEVVVPDVPPGNDYRIVLFGDSGNFSAPFTIAEGPTDS